MVSDEYLRYIPTIFEDTTINAVTLMILPAVFYTLASYGHLYFKDISVRNAVVMAITFAVMEYIVRVPIIRYARNVAGLSNFTMQVLWVSITITLALLSDQMFQEVTPGGI